MLSVSASYWLSYWSENRNDDNPWFYLGIVGREGEGERVVVLRQKDNYE